MQQKLQGSSSWVTQKKVEISVDLEQSGKAECRRMDWGCEKPRTGIQLTLLETLWVPDLCCAIQRMHRIMKQRVPASSLAQY